MAILAKSGLYDEETLSLLTIEEYEALHSELQKRYRDLYGDVYIKRAWVVVTDTNPS